jgi:hypothetical protein
MPMSTASWETDSACSAWITVPAEPMPLDAAATGAEEDVAAPVFAEPERTGTAFEAAAAAAGAVAAEVAATGTDAEPVAAATGAAAMDVEQMAESAEDGPAAAQPVHRRGRGSTRAAATGAGAHERLRSHRPA